jgi:cation diffusion facilitator CzcD-associated flavoprotein CzcO
VRLRSEVVSRTWDDDAHLWRLELPGREQLTARFVISAVGAFVNPKEPAIPGLEDFRGDVLHSAAWDHSIPLRGRRAAIVGTGASALQIVPEIAPQLARLDVYQRTPIWVGPKFDAPMPRAAQRLFRDRPPLQEAVRRTTTRLVEAGLVGLVLNHDQLGWITRMGGWLGRNVWYRLQVRDPELRRRLTPDYEIGCKRPSVSNTYLRAFNRPNVELVTERIDRVTPSAIRTADGREREIDVLVLATGFRLATDPENYRRNLVRGRDGFDLAEFYAANHVRSYESVSMPGLPNHFVRVIAEAGRRGATAVEVREEATERWTRFATERLRRSLWHTGSCQTANSYYFDHHGDTPFLRPTSSRQAWRAARSFPLDDYRYETLRDADRPAVEAVAETA